MILGSRDNHQAAVTVPEGTIMEVVGLPIDDRFVIVKFNGQQFHMFASDLKERGHRINPVAA